MSDAGVKQDTGTVGRGWLAPQAGRGWLVAAEAVRGDVEGEVGDVNLEELRAVRTSLGFVAAVALGQVWDDAEPLGGRQLASGELAVVKAEVRGILERANSGVAIA